MIASLSRLVLFFILLGPVGIANSQPPLPPPDEQPNKKEVSQPGVKVADQGPIHEAFAQPGAEVRGKEMTAPKAPPPPINEVPPETKPDGDNVKWIPGYWAWDENKNDFIWVSGFYRNVPPSRAWEPGKWIVKDGKNIYTPGYWKPTDGTAVPKNLPEPPASIENGPSTPSDYADAMWVPGGWEYRNGQFVWRAGYWASPYRNMMWQPSQYVYNGSDYCYVPGYWDYPLEQRGLLYAPVYIQNEYYQNPGWSFTPQYGIGMGDSNGWGNGPLFGSMYMGPNYNNYYYGNGGYGPGNGYGGYGGYGDPYGLGGLGFGTGFGDPLFGYGGFVPWWFAGPGFFNPLWNHYNWLNRGDRGWGENARGRGRNGSGRGVGTGRGEVGRGLNGAIGRGTTSPRPVTSAAGAAGLAAQTATRNALSARSAQVVQPANQVLASQAFRAVSPTLRSGGGYNGVVGLGAVNPVPGFGSNGVNLRPAVGMAGVNSSPFRGSFAEPGFRGAGIESGYRGSSGYRGGAGVRSSGGRSGGGSRGGGHR
jgi:hypothetical protein